jgi:predicted metal-binding protein
MKEGCQDPNFPFLISGLLFLCDPSTSLHPFSRSFRPHVNIRYGAPHTLIRPSGPWQLQGAFSIYKDTEIELVGFTTCDGCPGGNVEYAGEEMVKNGVEVIHLATGFVVVFYPPCPYTETFKAFLEKRYGVKVVVGTHPIPKKYLEMHTYLGTWKDAKWTPLVAPTMSDEATRASYDQPDQ